MGSIAVPNDDKFRPAPPRVRFHLVDEGAGRGRVFMARRPKQQFEHDWRERNAFGVKAVMDVRRLRDWFRSEDLDASSLRRRFEPARCRNAFAGILKLTKVRYPRTIKSRMISSDQRSPNARGRRRPGIRSGLWV